MFNFFSKNIKEANDEINRLQKELEAKGIAHKELETKATSFEETKKNLEKDIETLKAEHASQVQKLSGEHQAKIDELTKAKEDTQKSVNREVAVKMASIGVPEESIKVASSKPQTVAEAVQHLSSLPRGSKERADFYNKNKGILTRPSQETQE